MAFSHGSRGGSSNPFPPHGRAARKGKRDPDRVFEKMPALLTRWALRADGLPNESELKKGRRKPKGRPEGIATAMVDGRCRVAQIATNRPGMSRTALGSHRYSKLGRDQIAEAPNVFLTATSHPSTPGSTAPGSHQSERGPDEPALAGPRRISERTREAGPSGEPGRRTSGAGCPPESAG